MQLPSKDGIACDLCGLHFKTDFTYFSYDCREVEVFNQQKISLESILTLPIVNSFDVCTNCFSIHKKSIVEHYQKMMSPKRRATSGDVICELTGEKLPSDYVYVTVAKISAVGVGKSPKVVVDRRHVEFKMSKDVYNGLTSSAANIKTTQQTNNWSTKV